MHERFIGQGKSHCFVIEATNKTWETWPFSDPSGVGYSSMSPRSLTFPKLLPQRQNITNHCFCIFSA